MADPQATDRGVFLNAGEPAEIERLRPKWLVRPLILIPLGPLFGFAAMAVWTVSDETGLYIALVVCPVCLCVIVRWIFFMGVRRDGTFLVATGALWSRRIRLAQIERVTDFNVFIRWRTRSGIRVFTPLVAFSAQEGSIEYVANRNRWAIAQIRHWVEQEQTTAVLISGGIDNARDDHDSSLNRPG